MTDTPTTPTTTEAIYAEHRKCGPKYDGCYSHWTFMEHCRADGMAWPCDVSRLARSTPAEALDSLTPDPRWTVSWTVTPNGTLPWHSATVWARDASGGLFGFSVMAGWPEQAEQMARDLLARLSPHNREADHE